MSILDVEVSLFLSYRNSVPSRTIKMIDFLTCRSEWLDKSVRLIRSMNDKGTRRALKSTLPAITVSGIFKDRHIDKLIKHSGFICLDFDNLPDLKLAHEQLLSCPYVAFLDTSVSGTGLFAIIPIRYTQNHRQHFNALKQDMKDMYGLEIDKACGDVCRLRGYACDGDHYINENAQIYERIKQDEVIPKKFVQTNYGGSRDRDRFNRLLERITRQRIDITQDRLDWVKIGYALAGEFGEAGRRAFHEISQYHPKYKFHECEKQYNSYMRGSRTCSISTVFYIAAKYGVILNEK